MLEKILKCCLIVFVYNNILLSYAQVPNDRIKLTDIQALTLRKGIYTTARRTSPIPQLQCTGGSAGCSRQPDVVQCYNRGLNDKNNVQWECKAELPRAVIFGNLKVSCEGYAYSGDPYVLAGSCGLTYSLVDQNASQKSGGIVGGVVGGIVLVVGVIVGVVCCCKCCRKSSPSAYQAPRPVPGPAPYYPPGPGPTPYYPPGPGPRPYYPAGPGGTTIINNPAPYAPAPYYHHHHHSGGYSGGGGGTHESAGFADSETR